MKRLVVLASGTGTNLQALLDAARDGALAAEVVAVVSDRADAGALHRAADAGVAAVALPLRDRADPDVRANFDRQLTLVVAAFAPDLIVLAGWGLILGAPFLDRFAGRIINVHPALLPDTGGVTVLTSRGELPVLRGPRVVRDALAQRLPITGATVHYATQSVDAGPVILREEVPMLAGDDELALHARIKAVEHRLLPRAVAMSLAAQAKEKE